MALRTTFSLQTPVVKNFEEDAGYRRIEGQGTLEATWQAWPGLHQLQKSDLITFVPQGSRAVVIAPHPDDEVLAFGGLLAMLAQATLSEGANHPPPLVVAVTDGEASHPGSQRWPPAQLAQRRTLESEQSLQQLGMLARQRVRLSLADGQVCGNQNTLTRQLQALLLPGDTVFSTWALDGHPDHEASAHAAASAAAHQQCKHWQAPVWMWHWAKPGQPQVPWHRMHQLELPAAALRRKLDAIQAHGTQLAWQDTGAPPVLTVPTLQRLMRPSEYLIAPVQEAF